jgi:hypothetical protein
MIPHVGDLVSYRGAVWLVEMVGDRVLKLSRRVSSRAKCVVRAARSKVKVIPWNG